MWDSLEDGTHPSVLHTGLGTMSVLLPLCLSSPFFLFSVLLSVLLIWLWPHLRFSFQSCHLSPSWFKSMSRPFPKQLSSFFFLKRQTLILMVVNEIFWLPTVIKVWSNLLCFVCFMYLKIMEDNEINLIKSLLTFKDFIKIFKVVEQKTFTSAWNC